MACGTALGTPAARPSVLAQRQVPLPSATAGAPASDPDATVARAIPDELLAAIRRPDAPSGANPGVQAGTGRAVALPSSAPTRQPAPTPRAAPAQPAPQARPAPVQPAPQPRAAPVQPAPQPRAAPVQPAQARPTPARKAVPMGARPGTSNGDAPRAPRAALWRVLGADLVDAVVALSPAGYAAVFVSGVAAPKDVMMWPEAVVDGVLTSQLALIVFAATSALIHVAQIAVLSTRGWPSLGAGLFGLRGIRKRDGQKAGMGALVRRAIGGLLSGGLLCIPAAMGWWLDGWHRGLADRLGGTVLVRKLDAR